MNLKYNLITIIILLSFYVVNSQNSDTDGIITGVLIDVDTELPLPYANIFILNTNTGEVSNEKGEFSIDITSLNEFDTIRFQYIGYSSYDIPVNALATNSIIRLKEHIFNLNEAVVFAREPNIRSIIKKVIEKKDLNYRSTTTKRQIFTRERYISTFNEINLKYKKSSIKDLDQELIARIEQSIPKNSTSYTDFLGIIYSSAIEEDSVKYKIDPIRAVSLKEKDIAELEQLEEIFKNVFANTEEKEYWKVKSGIFAQKLDIEEEAEAEGKDTINKNETKTRYFERRTSYKFRYSSFSNKDEWEFLYKPGRYDYELVGGTRVNGEDVYIIDFVPRSSGQYIGRVFISIATSALVRADYAYAEGKVGRDFHLLGVGYTENEFVASIYFEKKGDNYLLKYYSKKAGSDISLDRNIGLLKKRKRFLFDKKLKELKIGVEMAVNSESSIELLIIDEEIIDQQKYYDFKQKEKMEIIYVDQFDDSLWKGYSIIEPTKQMKEYKKQKIDYNF